MNIQQKINTKNLEALEKLVSIKRADREQRLKTISLTRPRPDQFLVEVDILFAETDNSLTDFDLEDKVSWLEGEDYEKQQRRLS